MKKLLLPGAVTVSAIAIAACGSSGGSSHAAAGSTSKPPASQAQQAGTSKTIQQCFVFEEVNSGQVCVDVSDRTLIQRGDQATGVGYKMTIENKSGGAASWTAILLRDEKGQEANSNFGETLELGGSGSDTTKYVMGTTDFTTFDDVVPAGQTYTFPKLIAFETGGSEFGGGAAFGTPQLLEFDGTGAVTTPTINVADLRQSDTISLPRR